MATHLMLKPRSPALQKVYAYWLRKRGHRLAPSRADIHPEEMRELLPHLYLIEPVGSPPRLRFRLAGTRIVDEYGNEITGKFIDELDLNAVSTPICAELERALDTCEPLDQ